MRVLSLKKRIKYVDIAKGVSILAVVLGHTPLSNHSFSAIYSWHIPIFFLISGLLGEFESDFRVYATKRFRQLMIPYFYYSVILVALVTARSFTQGGILESLIVFRDELVAVLLGSGILYKIGATEYKSVGAVWFLVASFEASIFAWIYVRFKQGVWLCLLVATASWISTFWGCCPFSIQGAGIGSLFIYAGFLIKEKHGYSFFENDSKRLAIIGLSSWILATCFCIHVNMFRGYLSHGPLSCIIALVISVWVINLCYLLEKSKVLFFRKMSEVFEHLGQRSLIVLCVHSLSLKAFHHGGTVEKLVRVGVYKVFAIAIIVLVDLGMSLLVSCIIDFVKKHFSKQSFANNF